ncbi:MAG: large subunit ribosomal protein [Myxococcales bacterium]|jgi:large subunit ribosomal protein L6|nr:large subunit ribosomal protein [Myxococcales bacterium]
MSRIGRKVLPLPKGVTLNQKSGSVGVKGPKGELTKAVPAGISIKVDGDKINVVRADDSRENRSKHGLMRAHLANMVKGVTDGWTRELEINGVGYRAEVTGDTLTMALGFSHPVIFKLPKGVGAKVEKNRIALTSADRDLLGLTAAKVREIRPPEPYKGKGVKYVEETIKRKVGKAGATSGGA